MHVITENEARNLAQRIDRGGKLVVPPDTILTPMARDYLRGRGIEISDSHTRSDSSGDKPSVRGSRGDEALVEAVTQEVSRVLKESGAKDQPAAIQSAAEHATSALANAARTGNPSAQRAVVWGIGGDRPGILADVAELLKKWQMNILEISQTILSGVFAMVVIVDISKTAGQFAEFKAELEALGKKLGVNLSAQRDEIFQYMHRV
jgi:ACT domain-containing protein